MRECGSIILTPVMIQLCCDIAHLSHNEEGNVAQQQWNNEISPWNTEVKP